jgi:peptidoglycan-associated lipoprotein
MDLLGKGLRSALYGAIGLAAVALLAVGCGKTYPKCDEDKDCHQAEFCVNGTCQQCRGDQDCAAGQRCASGACQPIPGYCTSTADCGPGQECQNNLCVAQAQSAAPPEAPAYTGGQCTLESVYFEFDSSTLDQGSRDKLSQTASCIKTRAIKSVHLTGLTDNRGTEEYNLALGDRRAQAAKKYLDSLATGASTSASSMGEELATGTDDASFGRDRRVDFQEK